MAITNSNTTNQNQNTFDQFFQQQNQTNGNTISFEELMGGARQTNQAENDFLKLMGGATDTGQVTENANLVNEQPAVPSSETAQVQQMNAIANATRDNLNQQADQISSNGAWSNLETSNEGTLIPNADSSNSSDATLIPNSGWSDVATGGGYYNDIPIFNPNRGAMQDGLTNEEKQRIIGENQYNRYMFEEQSGYQTIWEGKVTVSDSARSALTNRGSAIGWDISKTLNIQEGSGISWEAAKDRYPSTHPYADNYLKWGSNEVYVVVKQKVPENTNTGNTVGGVDLINNPNNQPKNDSAIDQFVKDMTDRSGNWGRYGSNKYAALNKFIQGKTIDKQGETIRKLANLDAETATELIAQAGREKNLTISNALKPAFLTNFSQKSDGSYEYTYKASLNAVIQNSFIPSETTQKPRLIDVNNAFKNSNSIELRKAFTDRVGDLFNKDPKTFDEELANKGAPDFRNRPSDLLEVIKLAKQDNVMFGRLSSSTETDEIYKSILKSGNKTNFGRDIYDTSDNKPLYEHYMEAFSKFKPNQGDKNGEVLDILKKVDINKNSDVLKGAVSIPKFMKDVYQATDSFISKENKNLSDLNQKGVEHLETVLKLSKESTFDNQEDKNAAVGFLNNHLDIVTSRGANKSETVEQLSNVIRYAALENEEKAKSKEGFKSIADELQRLQETTIKNIDNATGDRKINGEKAGVLLAALAKATASAQTTNGLETASGLLDPLIDAGAGLVPGGPVMKKVLEAGAKSLLNKVKDAVVKQLSENTTIIKNKDVAKELILASISEERTTATEKIRDQANELKIDLRTKFSGEELNSKIKEVDDKFLVFSERFNEYYDAMKEKFEIHSK
jgi:hypothetical protein